MITVGILATARQRHGGTLLYTLSMIDALRRLPTTDYRVVLFVAADNREYDGLDLPIQRLPTSPLRLAARLIAGTPFGTADVVIAPVYSIALLRCGRPFVFTLHDMQERYYPQYFSLATRLWRRLVNRALTARAARIVCESNFVKRDIMQFLGTPEHRIAVVPAPPISQLRNSAPDGRALEAIRTKYQLPMRYVFYAAQFWPHKNHMRLVEAFGLLAREHADCALVLTGKQRDEFDRVFRCVRELGLESRVRHIGYVEQADLAALYRAATVVAVPTLFESISIPVYEAFSLGAAVCASNVVALPEQIGDAGLLFDPLSTRDIAEKIGALLADPQLRATLVARGHERMASVTHDQYAAQLRSIIDAVCRPASAKAT